MIKKNIPQEMKATLKRDARALAEILIHLQQKYPLFFNDVANDDPDMDMDKGFKTYEQMRRHHAD